MNKIDMHRTIEHQLSFDKYVAAITRFFNDDGINIFADYRYSPNHYFYNGIYNALVSLKKGY